jgi:hypothetical protein
MIKVNWPTRSMETQAQVWRVLDLCGMTKSVRESRNFTKAGYVSLNGNPVLSLKTTVGLGVPFTLTLTFPNGVVREAEIMLTPWDRTRTLTQRQTGPSDRGHKG